MSERKRSRQSEAGILDNEIWDALLSCKHGRSLIAKRLQVYRRFFTAKERHEQLMLDRGFVESTHRNVSNIIRDVLFGVSTNKKESQDE